MQCKLAYATLSFFLLHYSKCRTVHCKTRTLHTEAIQCKAVVVLHSTKNCHSETEQQRQERSGTRLTFFLKLWWNAWNHCIIHLLAEQASQCSTRYQSWYDDRHSIFCFLYNGQSIFTSIYDQIIMSVSSCMNTCWFVITPLLVRAVCTTPNASCPPSFLSKMNCKTCSLQRFQEPTDSLPLWTV